MVSAWHYGLFSPKLQRAERQHLDDTMMVNVD